MTFKKRRFATIVLLVVSSTLLIGCGKSPTPTTVESIISTPVEGQSSTSPQPTPTPLPPSRSRLPTPSSSDIGVVGGVLLRDIDSTDSTPSAETTLQLARVIRSEDGTPLVATAGDKSSPTTVTDQSGSFAFTDVPPNTYGLVLVSPVGSFMLKDETGDNLLIDVESGEVLDLGEVHTDVPY